MKRYETLAHALAEQIRNGVFQAGERIPGTRTLARQFGVSISTVMQAQRLLESWGVAEARPRSGYYVRWQPPAQPEPAPASSQPDGIPTPVSNQHLVLQLVQATAQPHMLQLGAAVPDSSFLPTTELHRMAARVARHEADHCTHYDFPPGDPELRRQIARRMADAGCLLSADEIVITNGCHEALLLALQTITAPGDVIALESPTYYGLLQVIESLGLKALEIPTDPQQGISLAALELACEQWPVKACVVVTNFSNPLGSCLSDARKRALVQLLARYDVPLVEDDIYGELGFAARRPSAAKAYDTEGRVLYCSSFSKTLAPGMRVGWIAPGRYLQQVIYRKFTLSLATATLPQRTLARYLENGHYDRHLRRVRNAFASQMARVAETVLGHFPSGTRVTQPNGGFVLWVELPAGCDTMRLHREALAHRISLAPGNLFSVSDKYGHCLRLNCALPWDNRLQQALVWLAERVRAQLT